MKAIGIEEIAYACLTKNGKKWQHLLPPGFSSGLQIAACSEVWLVRPVHNVKNGTSSGKRPHRISSCCSSKLRKKSATYCATDTAVSAPIQGTQPKAAATAAQDQDPVQGPTLSTPCALLWALKISKLVCYIIALGWINRLLYLLWETIK